MNKIDTDFVRQKWQYKPELAIADTTSISDLYCTTNSTSIADEINKRVKELYKERETRMIDVKFNDLEKELKEFGIQLSTIRHSSGDAGCEIEGYLRPDIYKIHRAKKMCSVPITTKKPIPKKVKFSGPATIILWEDGTKTVVKCQKEDVWSDEVGIAMCYLKKMFGNKGNFNNIFRQAMKVAEVQTKNEELASSSATGGGSVTATASYYSSALENMSDNIDMINNFMKDAADALDKALGGKK